MQYKKIKYWQALQDWKRSENHQFCGNGSRNHSRQLHHSKFHFMFKCSHGKQLQCEGLSGGIVIQL